MKKTLGFIVNPVAGIGGKVGLKGSDGITIQQRAWQMGATPIAPEHSIEALKRLREIEKEVEIVTCPGEMGEIEAKLSGFNPIVIGSIYSGNTTADDTIAAARTMLSMFVNLIMFAGGDGTARDIYTAIGNSVPTIGIPAGVKIHSGVFAINPTSAGDIAARYLMGDINTLCDAEVLDLDEESYRRGIVSSNLFGFLKIPYQRRLIQSCKSPSRVIERSILDGIAFDVIDNMQEDFLYIIGPGTTTRPIVTNLGIEKTLIGVDVIMNRHLIDADVNEAKLLKLLKANPGKIVVTPIGGQGFIFGRGNQQISPSVLKIVDRENIIIVSTMEKIINLGGRPLLINSGDNEVDKMLCGYWRVITSYNERIVYQVSEN